MLSTPRYLTKSNGVLRLPKLSKYSTLLTTFLYATLCVPGLSLLSKLITSYTNLRDPISGDAFRINAPRKCSIFIDFSYFFSLFHYFFITSIPNSDFSFMALVTARGADFSPILASLDNTRFQAFSSKTLLAAFLASILSFTTSLSFR